MNIKFPLYRKYPNNKSYFKVLSAESFEEIQVVGSKYLLTRVNAQILPDRYFIADMIEASSHWVKIDEVEYAHVAGQIKR